MTPRPEKKPITILLYFFILKVTSPVLTMDIVRYIVKTVYDELGPSFSESVYHRAIEVLLRENGIPYETERIVPVTFHGYTIGNMRADLVIRDPQMVVELKSTRGLNESNRNQIRSYLRLMDIEHGLLVNFGSFDGLQMELISEKSLQSPTAPPSRVLDLDSPPPEPQ